MPSDPLGHTYRLIGQVDKAIEYYQQALGIAREMGDQRFEGRVLFSLGSANRLMKRYEEALADFERAIELDPDKDWYHYERGLIYLAKDTPHLAQNDFSRAVDLARQIYEENSQNWRNAFNLALYTLISGDLEKAEQLCQEVIKSRPPQQIIREAVDDLTDFLNFFPDHSQAQAMRNLLQQSLLRSRVESVQGESYPA